MERLNAKEKELIRSLEERKKDPLKPFKGTVSLSTQTVMTDILQEKGKKETFRRFSRKERKQEALEQLQFQEKFVKSCSTLRTILQGKAEDLKRLNAKEEELTKASAAFRELLKEKGETEDLTIRLNVKAVELIKASAALREFLKEKGEKILLESIKKKEKKEAVEWFQNEEKEILQHWTMLGIILEDKREILERLQSKENEMLESCTASIKTLEEESEREIHLHNLFREISTIGFSLVRRVDMFKAPISEGSKRFCLRNFKVLPWANFQIESLKQYKDKLFFTVS